MGLTIAMTLAGGAAGYYSMGGTKRERVLTSVVGMGIGYIAGKLVSNAVGSLPAPVSPAANPST